MVACTHETHASINAATHRGPRYAVKPRACGCKPPASPPHRDAAATNGRAASFRQALHHMRCHALRFLRVEEAHDASKQQKKKKKPTSEDEA